MQVNGRVVVQPGAKADWSRDQIMVDGVVLSPPPALSYFILHKPLGTVSTLFDPQGRPTVRELLPFPQRLFPVGRLDRDSSGLLLMTNDGELAYRLTHPRFRIPKVYRVQVRGLPTSEALEGLRQGVPLPEGKATPARVRVVRKHRGSCWLELTLCEGRKRQVRRMCEAVGYPVLRLIRIRFGPLALGFLPPGAFRPLTVEEVRGLKRAVGLA